MNAKKANRRTIIKTGALASAFALTAFRTAYSNTGIPGAGDKIRLGFVGIANRGSQLLDAFRIHPDVEIAALCDVHAKTLEKAGEKYGRKVYATTDFRELLDRKDIDGLVLATPDHWHAIQTIEACKAGKDVYVEKPLCVTVVEGRKMVEAARKYNRIVQVGIHRRSSPLYRHLFEQGVEKLIGHVTVGRSFRPSNMYPSGIGKADPGTPPGDLDWDMWLGPRPKQPYRETIAPYKFRWWDLYSSQMGNWGVHFLDAMMWLLEEKAPVSLCAMGGKYAIDDDRTIPDTAEAIFEFDRGRLLSFCQYEACGNPCMATDDRFRPLGEIELRGTNGTVYINEKHYVIRPEIPGQFQKKTERIKEVRHDEPRIRSNQEITEAHARNFLDCMKDRTLPSCDVEIGHRSTTLALLANISLAVRQRLDWDAEKERFIDNEPANQLLHYEYRAPWKLEV